MKFNESDFGDKDEMTTTSTVDSSIAPMKNVKEETVGEEVIKEPRTSARIRKAPVRFGYDEYAETASPVGQVRHVAYNVCEVEEPISMKEARTNEHSRVDICC